MKKLLIPALIFVSVGYSCSQPKSKPEIPNTKTTMTTEKINKSEEDWKKELSPEQYHILRNKGTERPFTGKYDKFNEKGSYVCAACGNPLFDSDAKFDAGCGWPSFFKSLDSTKITLQADNSLGVARTEIMCARCGGHLGHVFDDGPAPTGLRYCVNSISLDFKKLKLENTGQKK
jgi:methionine-R-sulfoxide reductase